jgi:phosphotransacetylase
VREIESMGDLISWDTLSAAGLQVAAVKIKTKNEVAGRATVFIFPDLNTGE